MKILQSLNPASMIGIAILIDLATSQAASVLPNTSKHQYGKKWNCHFWNSSLKFSNPGQTRASTPFVHWILYKTNRNYLSACDIGFQSCDLKTQIWKCGKPQLPTDVKTLIWDCLLLMDSKKPFCLS